MPTTTDTTARTAARVAGLGYAALFFLAIFANFVVRQGLVVDDDPAATVENLTTDGQLLRWGIVAFVVVFLLDVAISWALYVLLRPGGTARSLVAAWFRLAHTFLLGVAVTFLFLALQLASGPLSAGLESADREVWTALAVEAFDYTWLVGLVAFGVHLVLAGRLLATAMGARVLGLLLTVAGIAYVLDTAAYTLLADYADHEDLFLAIVAVPSVVAELGFTVWLLRRGWGRTVGDDADGPGDVATAGEAALVGSPG